MDLDGRKYDGKRNFITRIKADREYEYVRMSQPTADESQEFADYWCEMRWCETVEGLREERMAP